MKMFSGAHVRVWLGWAALLAAGYVVGAWVRVPSGEMPLRGRLDGLQASQSKLLAESSSIQSQLVDVRTLLRSLGAIRPEKAVTDLPRESLPLAGASIKGSRQAPVAIIEYSDFQCSFCATFARETLPALDKTYISTGKVLLVFRNFPLQEIHPHAVEAAESAECAGRQGKFWEMHDALFANQSQLEEAHLIARAQTLGLHLPKFTDCLRGNSAVRVRHDTSSGRALRLTLTPTFFIGVTQPDGTVAVKTKIEGAKDLGAFRTAIDALLPTTSR